MQQPWFKDWFNTPYYHQLYFKRDEKEAAAYPSADTAANALHSVKDREDRITAEDRAWDGDS